MLLALRDTLTAKQLKAHRCQLRGSLHAWTLLVRILVRDFSPVAQVFNEVRFHRPLSPPFGSLFIFVPFTHLSFPFFFHVSSLHVLSSHPFFRTHAHIHILFKPRFQVAQVLIMRWVSSFVPVHVGSLSSQPHTYIHTYIHTYGLSCPPFTSSFVCLFCAHTRTFVATLVFLASLNGRRARACMCVCVTLGVTGILLDWIAFLLFSAGAVPHCS